MKKWRHVRMNRDANLSRIEIFPARNVDLEWLYQQFPQIKKGKQSNTSTLVIEPKNQAMLESVEDAIINYLEENGWEGYTYLPNWNTYAFKRLEEQSPQDKNQ